MDNAVLRIEHHRLAGVADQTDDVGWRPVGKRAPGAHSGRSHKTTRPGRRPDSEPEINWAAPQVQTRHGMGRSHWVLSRRTGKVAKSAVFLSRHRTILGKRTGSLMNENVTSVRENRRLSPPRSLSDERTDDSSV